MDRIGESDRLWLEHEPSYDEVTEAFTKFNMDEYEELVFCGFGEPTESFDLLIKVDEYAKNTFGKKIRINTNGMGNLINFAKECTKVIPKVVLTTVDTTISKEDEEKSRLLCEEIGAVYRIRPWEQ